MPLRRRAHWCELLLCTARQTPFAINGTYDSSQAWSTGTSRPPARVHTTSSSAVGSSKTTVLQVPPRPRFRHLDPPHERDKRLRISLPGLTTPTRSAFGPAKLSPTTETWDLNVGLLDQHDALTWACKYNQAVRRRPLAGSSNPSQIVPFGQRRTRATHANPSDGTIPGARSSTARMKTTWRAWSRSTC